MRERSADPLAGPEGTPPRVIGQSLNDHLVLDAFGNRTWQSNSATSEGGPHARRRKMSRAFERGWSDGYHIRMTSPVNNSQCVILVPANYGVEPECERGLVQLERRGYPVWRVPGFAAIDQCRNQVATDALARGFQELMWIDADMAFEPDAVDRLRAAALSLANSAGQGGQSPPDLPPIVAAIYPKKGQRALSSRLFSATKEVTFGAGGGLIEILYAATGFLHTRREAYEAIQRHWNLPLCNEQFGKPMVPYFMPMVVDSERGPSYLADDFSFSHRARAAGVKIYADTTIRVGHIGRYAFSWEEAGGSNQRFATYIYRVLDAREQ
jgi:hypothetical protein